MFNTLQSNNWINFTAQNMLILKIDSTSYRAFTNSCPHQGAKKCMGFIENPTTDFVCSGGHDNTYATDCQTAGVEVLKRVTQHHNDSTSLLPVSYLKIQ